MQKVFDHLVAAAHELVKTVVPSANSNSVISSSEEILLENEDVKVTRVKIPPGITHVPSEPSRLKRVIVQLNDNLKKHTLTAHNHTSKLATETVHRSAGHVTFRDASSHVVTNTGPDDSDTIIIELKK